MERVIKGLVLCLGLFLLAACEDDTKEGTFYSRFDPMNGIIPYPNNLLFNGSQDLTLNIPVVDEGDYSDPKVALNTLDGFSTTAPLTATFSSAIEPESIIPGETVRLFEVTLGAQLEVTGVKVELAPELDYTVELSSADPYQTTLTVQPKRPLAAGKSYLVVLTDGIKGQDGTYANAEFEYTMTKSQVPLIDESGTSRFSTLTDEEAQLLEPIRLLTNAAEESVEAYTTVMDKNELVTNLVRSEIVLSWSFKTQSIGNTLDDVISGINSDSIDSGPIAAVPTGVNTPGGYAAIYAGLLGSPYYLTASSGENGIEPLIAFWHDTEGDFLLPGEVPVATSTQQLPLLLTVPKSATPATGWPVVIFQHGITRNRTDLLAIADGLAAAGFAAVAIDLPLHGLTTTDESDPLFALKMPGERTFGLDLVNNIDGTPVPDGVTDESGTHFINLGNLLVTRDNVRQSVIDLAVLRHNLEDLNSSDAQPMVDVNRVYFVGHSLGGMVGSVFLTYAADPDSSDYVQDAVLAMPGGGIAKLLDGSPSFGPRIAAGLESFGLIKGTLEYEDFMNAAQTVVDTADPINYAEAHDLENGRGILLFEVVGGNSSPSDQVIPNNVLPESAPDTVSSLLAGTDPMATLMGLSMWSGEDPAGYDRKVWMRFNAGHHGSLLTTNDAYGNADALSGEVYWEMLGQMTYFLATGGSVNSVNLNVLTTQ